MNTKRLALKTIYRLVGIVLFYFTLMFNASAQTPAGGSYDSGVKLFNAKDYVRAVEAFTFSL